MQSLNSHYEGWSYKKKKKKVKIIEENCIVPINSRLKAIYIIGQKKAFCGQRIPESSCTRKETVDIEILIISRRKGDKKSRNLLE